jgi:uncharacterized membrane protein SpoIIM required for sporulation
MDYPTFVARGQPDWDALEEMLARARRGMSTLDHDEVERLAAHHRRVISDFAYATTHFRGTEAEARLRTLSFAGHRLLATRHRAALPRILRFFTHGFPRVFREHLPTLGATLGLFLLATLLGFTITVANEQLAWLFLGADAIQGLREGRIWTDSVGSLAPASVTSSRIMTNNMSVALVAWAGGALFGALTVWVLTLNGLMLGSVVALVWRYDLLDRLLAFVSAHGPLELYLITVAAAAGLTMARGQIAFDNRPRGVAFREGARRSVRLVVGTLPWFVLLGLVEGYVSPEMAVATGPKLALGLVLLAAFLLYAFGVVRLGGRHGADDRATEAA